MTTPRLLALSDLHVAFPPNREIVSALRPGDDGDWLLLVGDVGELYPDIEWALRMLSERFATVVWTPGNHELWTRRKDPVSLRGEARYLALVELCRGLGILTPEDSYPVWNGPGGPVTIAPVFLLYDYTFLPDGALTKEQGLKQAYEKGIVCRDEALLHPDPYPSHRTPARRAGPRAPDRLRHALPTRPRAHAGPALPAVRAVVRNHADGRLAPALQRRRGRLRPPAHPAGHVVRRCPVRGGLGRLSAGMAPPQRPARPPAANPAGDPSQAAMVSAGVRISSPSLAR